MNYWLKDDQCTGCAACANICPKKAITMRPDESGFIKPVIQQELCINCGCCEKACPVLHPVPPKGNTDSPAIYAAWSLDGSTRYKSTSGGAFSELCKGIYARGGAVVGAAYDEDMMIRHVVTTNVQELDLIRQSKYAQSEIGDVFRQIKKLLLEDREVLFCGCPCQVAGLFSYLGKPYEKLYTVDFICRGSNSPKAYRKWLDMLETKYHARATRVWFKNKECGWNRFSTRVDFENGKVYRKDRYHDLFMKGYLEKNLYIRPSCAQCPFKGLPRMADITLADFWRVDKKLDADMGTSMVVINNERGAQLLEACKYQLFLQERTLDEALKGNRMFDTSAWVSRYSGEFLRSLDTLRFDHAYYKMAFKLKRLKRRSQKNAPKGTPPSGGSGKKPAGNGKAKKAPPAKAAAPKPDKQKQNKPVVSSLRSTTVKTGKKLYQFRFLFEELVKRDFKKKYKRTSLGMIWSILNPLLTLLVMSLVFTQFFGRNMEHYTIYLFSGNLLFSYYRESTTSGMSALISNAGIFSKVNVPKYLFVLSSNISSLINFLLTLFVYFIFVIFDGLPITPKFLMLLFPIVCMVTFNVGMGLILSALNVFFRDMKYLFDVFNLMLMYLSAIFYQVDSYPATIQRLFLLNPVYVFIKYFRLIVIDSSIPSLMYHGLALGYALLALIVGALIYKKQNNRFLYYI